jgi:hypothetical protein
MFARPKLTWVRHVYQIQVPSLPNLQALDLVLLYIYIYIYIVFLKNNALFVYIFSNKFLVYV